MSPSKQAYEDHVVIVAVVVVVVVADGSEFPRVCEVVVVSLSRGGGRERGLLAE